MSHPIVAYRGYNLNIDRAGLSGAYEMWATRQLTGECQGAGYWQDGKKRCRTHILGRMLKKNCLCGINGSWKPEGSSILGNIVVALCTFWGATELAAYGLRAEHGRMLKLYINEEKVRDRIASWRRSRKERKSMDLLFNRFVAGLQFRYKVPVTVTTADAISKLPNTKPNYDELDASNTSPLGKKLEAKRIRMRMERADLARKVVNNLGMTDDTDWWQREQIQDKVRERIGAFERTSKWTRANKAIIDEALRIVGEMSS